MGHSKQQHMDMRDETYDTQAEAQWAQDANYAEYQAMLEREQQTGVVIKQKTFLDLDTAGIKDFAMDLVDKFTDGFNSPTEGLIFAKKLAEAAELIKENLQAPAISEMRLGKGEKYIGHNVTINEQMVGVRYSFKECGDPVWNELNEKIKNREAFLKTIKGSKEELIEETGEVVTIYEPVKSGKLSPVVKIL